MTVKVTRIYDQATEHDGHRVLVDRVWPRGLTKSRADIDEWCKQVAPTTALRKWYSHDAMAAWLPANGMAYRWLTALGGRRKPSPDSANAGWRNPQFRAYADYMASEEFTAGVSELKEPGRHRADPGRPRLPRQTPDLARTALWCSAQWLASDLPRS